MRILQRSLPRVYADSWICLNPSCSNFWYSHEDQIPERETLALFPAFLKHRNPPTMQTLRPTYHLVPDVMASFEGIKGTQQAAAVSSLLWKGMVCPDCHRCNVRIFWHQWYCVRCNRSFPYNVGALDLRAVIRTRAELSFAGHPPVNIVMPDDYDYQGPIGREVYRVDKVVLHDSMLILLSPTARFNEHPQGPNMLWKQTLAAANNGQLDLQRILMSRPQGSRSRHFASNFGTEYDFSERRSTPFEQAPECVRHAVETLNGAQRAELPQHFEEPNAAQFFGFMDGMFLD